MTFTDFMKANSDLDNQWKKHFLQEKITNIALDIEQLLNVINSNNDNFKGWSLTSKSVPVQQQNNLKRLNALQKELNESDKFLRKLIKIDGF